MIDRIQRELDRLASQLGCGVSLDDPYGIVIASSMHESGADEARTRAILQRRVPEDIRQWERSQHIRDADGIVRLPPAPELGLRSRICVPLWNSGFLVALLWILDPPDSLEETGREAIQETTTRIRDEIHANQRSSDEYATAVSNLLSIPPVRANESYRTLNRWEPGIASQKLQVTTLAAAAPGSSTLQELPEPAHHLLEATFSRPQINPSDIVGTYLNRRYATVLTRANSHRIDSDARDLLASTRQTVDRETLTIGWSNIFTASRKDIHTACLHAVAAAEIAAIDPSFPCDLAWADTGVYKHLLLLSRGKPYPSHHQLDALTAADETQTLTTTLETHLDLGTVAATAAALHLTRGSIYYRLKRITQLSGIQLETGLQRLDVHLALKLRRLFMYGHHTRTRKVPKFRQLSIH